MRIVLGCIRETQITALRYILGLTSAKSGHSLALVKAYMHITNHYQQPLYVNLNYTKDRRFKS